MHTLTPRDHIAPARRSRKIEFKDREPETSLKPTDPNASIQYETGKGCLLLGGLVVLMLAGIVVLILLVGDPVA